MAEDSESRAAERRGAILAAAIPLFARGGFAGVEVDAIATAAGCAKGTIYRYFENKESLFRACVDRVMTGLLERTEAPGEPDLVRRIEFGVRAYLAYFEDHPEYIELLIQERAGFRDRERPSFYEFQARRHAEAMPEIGAMMEAGRLRRMDPQRVLDVLGNVLYGTIFTNHFAGRTISLDEQAGTILRVVLVGLLTPGEAAAWLERTESGADAPARGGRDGG